MLQVVTGRFYPHLESALVDHIHRAKAADPFAAVAVLVPSAPLLDRLRRFLAVEQGLSLLNVHLLSFHQLALRLADERRAQSGTTPLRVVDDLFFEQLVRHLVRSRLSGLAPLQRIGHSSGTWGALWSTIRDLKDGGVDPVGALGAVREGCFDPDETDWLQALFSLHAAVKDVGAALQVGTADDLAESLLAYIPQSPFLGSLRHVFYYGFYDLTQVQLSLFEAVAATAPTTLFFPLEEGRAYEFARRFYERQIQPKAVRPAVLSGLSPAPTLSIQSVIGAEEELAATCRTILDLCETNGYRFHEIGVVARTLDPYRTVVQGVFERYCIPFVTTAGRPLIQEPLCKVLLQLASLPVNDFYRTAVLDIVTSPLYRRPEPDGSGRHRQERWKMIVTALRITHGREEWARLERAARSALIIDGEPDEAGTNLALDVAPDIVAHCWSVVSRLLDDGAALPQRGTLAQLLDAFRRLIARCLARPDATMVEGHDPQAVRLEAAWAAIERTLATLQDLDAIGEELTWAEFVELLTHALERAAVPLSTDRQQGVMVLDAMAARGLPFKALFVLGLNEKVFPRYIREDPFLRDRNRLILDTTLGFKIDQKLGAYDEETLLFTLLGQAAIQRLHLSFQRADDNGRPLAPSPYVAEGAKRWGLSDCPVDALARRVTDRVARRPTTKLWLPPMELAQWMAMQGQDPAPLLAAVGQDAELFRHAATALERLEDDSPVLTAFDGQTGPLLSHWSRVMERGLAPTPLERYANCPFRYFAADVLYLEPIRLPPTQGPDALALGTLIHAALRRCYESLVEKGWPATTLDDPVIRRLVQEAVAHAAVDCEREHPTGHFLLWELAKERVTELVAAVIASDQAAYAETPFQPVAFEKEAAGTVSVSIQGESIAMKIRGRMDRIDRHRVSGALRIVDYKYKTGADMKPEDRNLPQSAARGFRLQPPVYARLDLPELGPAHEVQFLFIAPYWSTPIVRSTFERRAWSGDCGATIQNTVNRLVAGLRDGRFFILPDGYCQHCEYRVACRREHQPSWWRSHRARETKELRALRSIKVDHE